jgi:hypothetical protein
LFNHQWVELDFTFTQWEYDATSMWVPWRDVIATGLGDNLFAGIEEVGWFSRDEAFCDVPPQRAARRSYPRR